MVIYYMYFGIKIHNKVSEVVLYNVEALSWILFYFVGIELKQYTGEI